MLNVHVCQSPIGMLRRESFSVDWSAQSYGEILEAFRDPAWSRTAPIAVSCGGYRVSDLSAVPPDGAHVSIAPDPGFALLGGAIPAFILGTALTIGLNIAIAKLTAPDLDPVEPGDETSPTYGFSGVYTSYGTGYRVPIVYGDGAVGGHAISTDVTPIDPTTNAETFRAVLVLSEGPIHSIGGVSRELEVATPNGTGQFPERILVNDTALVADSASDGNAGGIYVSTRLGTPDQLPMRGFEEPTAVQAVDAELRSQGDAAVVFIDGVDSTRARIQVDFPNGLYRQHAGGVVPIDEFGPDASFNVKVRATPPAVEWDAIQGSDHQVEFGPVGRREAASVAVEEILVPDRVDGTHNGYEIRVERTSPTHADTSAEVFVEEMVFRRVVHGPDSRVAYTSRALCGVSLRGTERLQSTRPNWRIFGKFKTVRVWDAAHGVSEKEYFDLPESGDDYHGIWTYPPGENAAWQAVDYIRKDYAIRSSVLPRGGDIDDHIDWPAFRNLADYCDQTYTFHEGEDSEYDAMFHRSFIALDRGLEGWPGLMSILRSCRARPMRVGNKISVVYFYKEAHGRGTNSVPAKSICGVVGTGSVEDFRLQYLPLDERINVLYGQFANRDKNFDVDEIPREDLNAAFEASSLLQEQARRGTVRMLGVTEPDRVIRELDFMHAVNRLADRTVAFVGGIAELPYEPGDIIGVQHDAMRPLSGDAVYVSARTAAAVSGTSVTLTRKVEVPAADTAYNVTYKATNGDVERTTLTPPAGQTEIAAGATWTAADTVTCTQGAEFVFGGPGSEDIEEYQITSLRLKDDLKVEIEALLWTPEAYEL